MNTGRADVAVIGHGIVGSVAARCLAEAGARVLLVEAGSALAPVGGTHLRNLPACRADRSYHYDLVRACLRPASLPRPDGAPAGAAPPPMPAGNGVNPAQRARGNLVAARLTSLHGGMGALWNCVAPRLHPRLEQWPDITAAEWDTLYRHAEALLWVDRSAGAGSTRQQYLLRSLAGLSGAAPAPAPVAARRHPDRPGELRWTGPAEVLADADAGTRARIDVLSGHAVRRLRHRAGQVLDAEAVDTRTGAVVPIRAGVFLLAAGGVRTPALLWASGIGTDRGADSPLGRYLCDHPLAHAQVVLDPQALGPDLDRAGPDPCVVIPVSDRRPFHALLICDGYDAAALEGRIDERLIVSLYWYALAQPRPDNRVVFRPGPTDAVGLPQPTFEYRPSAPDRDRQRAALADLRAAGATLGTFLPGSPPRLLSPGASLHVLGTTRMGRHDDGHSVVDSHGRVWGFANLYLGGTGLVPSATATNPTLAACALAVRTARRIARPGPPPPRLTR